MIGSHLRSLCQFSGAEPRVRFWPWAGIVFGFSVLPFLGAMVPALLDGFEKMQRFARDHPDQATVSSAPGHYEIQIEGFHPELMPDLTIPMAMLAVSAALMTVLLAASVARRLHDTGRSGAWGLMPLPFLIVSIVFMPRMLNGTSVPDMALFGLTCVNNMIYNVSLITLVVLLAQPTKRSANSRAT